MTLRWIIVLVLLSHSAFSQERKITVRIVESGTETPIRDANVTVPGTSITTFSNHLGYFELAVDPAIHSTLQISHISFKILQITIPAQDRFKLYLEKDMVQLQSINLNQYPLIPSDADVIIPTQVVDPGAEQEAMFPGGLESFYTYMGNALTTALPAVTDKGFEILFTIDEAGQATDLVISEPSEDVKTAVTKAFKNMPAWTPATQRQKNAKQLFILPVKRFTIPDVKSLDLKEFTTFIQRNIKYPAPARRLGIEGEVYTQFVTDESGNVVSVMLMSGIDESCNAEAKRIVSIIPSGLLKSLVDQTHQKEFVLPIFFVLGNSKKTNAPVPHTNAYLLPSVTVMAGGLTVQRREIGGSATTVSRMPYSEPVVITYLSLAGALEEPQSAKRLMLKRNQLKTFPPEILTLENLNFLDLESNQLQTIPNEIGTLTDLKELYLVQNQLSALPENFGKLEKLKTLGLSGNQFKTFPLVITQLEKLEKLDLSNNQLSVIPAEIGLMKDLEEIYLMNNSIYRIPSEFYSLKKLSKIYLKGNPINPDDLALLKKTFKKAAFDF